MGQFIIWVTGKPNLYGYRRRDFKWDANLNLFIFQGKIFDESTFNETVREAFEHHADFHPMVKLISTPAVEDLDSVPAPITVEQAIEVLLREAPDRLKKKPGPKPELIAC